MWKVNFIYTSSNNKVFIPKKDSICVLTNNIVNSSILPPPFNKDYLRIDDLSYFYRFNSDKYNLVLSIMVGKDGGTNLVIAVKGLYTDAINLRTNISNNVALNTNGIAFEIDKYTLSRLRLSGDSTFKNSIIDYMKANDNLVSVFDINPIVKTVNINSKGVFSNFSLPSNLMYELTLGIDTSGKVELSRGINRCLIKSYGNSYFLGSPSKNFNNANKDIVKVDELDNLLYNIVLDFFSIEPIDNTFLLSRLDSLLF